MTAAGDDEAGDESEEARLFRDAVRDVRPLATRTVVWCRRPNFRSRCKSVGGLARIGCRWGRGSRNAIWTSASWAR